MSERLLEDLGTSLCLAVTLTMGVTIWIARTTDSSVRFGSERVTALQCSAAAVRIRSGILSSGRTQSVAPLSKAALGIP